MPEIPVQVLLSVPLKMECGACGSDLAVDVLEDTDTGETICSVAPCRVCMRSTGQKAVEQYLEQVNQAPWVDGG